MLVLLVVRVVKVVIGVKVICFVDSYPDLISTTFANVPADLQSAGIKYKNRRSAQLIF